MKKSFDHETHGRPVTRRDFLAQGFAGSMAVAALPSIAAWAAFQPEAYGAECTAGSDSPMNRGFIPFLVFDMAGGGGLPANFLVGERGGPEDLLPNYDLLGWNPRTTELNRSFGIPLAAGGVGKLLEGILTTASPEARANLRMGSICHQAQDDTSSNRHSSLLEVGRAGYLGSIVNSGVGFLNTPAGGNTSPPEALPRLRPMHLKNVDDILGALSYGPALKKLQPQALRGLARALTQLSESQGQKLSRLSFGKQLAELAQCGFLKNEEQLTQTSMLDARLDPVFQSVYGIDAQSPNSGMPARVATIVMNVLRGNTGPGAIVVSGCDYHDGTQTTGDNKDLETGQWIGRAVESAYRLGVPLMFELITDGGVYPRKGTRVWLGDAGDKCMTIVGYYNPKKTPEMRRLQVGHYTAGQGAARDTFLGADTSKIAYASLANYLSVCGKLDLFGKLVPIAAFPADKIDETLLFA